MVACSNGDPWQAPHRVDEADVHNVHMEVVVAGLVVHVEAQLGGKRRSASHTADAPTGVARSHLQRQSDANPSAKTGPELVSSHLVWLDRWKLVVYCLR